jgi:2'-5' RNA ligase
MKEFVVVQMLEPADIGTRFTIWSLHMTLLPWFEAPSKDEVISKLKAKLKNYKPFEVEVGERTHFGQHKLRVKLVNNTPRLQSLHEALLSLVSENAWKLEGRYTGQHFKPHVTRKASRDASGRFTVDTLYVVERQPQGYREIVGKVEL